MKSYFYHLQINIDFEQNNQFYKDLMQYLGWNIIFEGDGMFGFRSDTTGDVWFLNSQKKEIMDYDMVGVNHISIRVEEQSNIDQILEFLKQRNIQSLFDTPRHRPEFTAKENETYYQIIFETPDKIQFEIVYIGKKL